jgi:predicted ABC-type ATPase
MATLFIISGCNGAGKTTVSRSILPSFNCNVYVNADEIAAELSPGNPESAAIEAGRIMLQRIDNLVDRAHAAGYMVVLAYFWLDSPYTAMLRVKERVREGGHNIPKDVIYRRYYLGIRNLFEIFMPIVDYWVLYDNNAEPTHIADTLYVSDREKFNKVEDYAR